MLLILDISDLSCPPKVMVGQPEGSVTLGSKVALTCHVAGNFDTAHWMHGGHVIGNSSLIGRQTNRAAQQIYVINTKKIKANQLWMNLTIVNVDM